eukprot:6723270-Prymnesium_polylepis.1
MPAAGSRGGVCERSATTRVQHAAHLAASPTIKRGVQPSKGRAGSIAQRRSNGRGRNGRNVRGRRGRAVWGGARGCGLNGRCG